MDREIQNTKSVKTFFVSSIVLSFIYLVGVILLQELIIRHTDFPVAIFRTVNGVLLIFSVVLSFLLNRIDRSTKVF